MDWTKKKNTKTLDKAYDTCSIQSLLLVIRWNFPLALQCIFRGPSEKKNNTLFFSCCPLSHALARAAPLLNGCSTAGMCSARSALRAYQFTRWFVRLGWLGVAKWVLRVGSLQRSLQAVACTGHPGLPLLCWAPHLSSAERGGLVQLESAS